MTHTYRIQLHTLPCPGREPMTRAIVYQGTTPIAQTVAYERNGGTGIAAALKDARALIDGRRVNDWFDWRPNESSDDFSKVTPQPPVLTVDGTEVKESETLMVKDYLGQYTTIMVIGGAILALVMKGCM